MLAKPDIQYVTQFYSYGSEAKVLELKPAQKKRRFALPVAMPQQKIHILVDPVAWAGILVSVVMVILWWSVRTAIWMHAPTMRL